MKKKAFTLVEMLVVIAVIITLMGFLLSGVKGALKQADRIKARTDIESLSAALKLFNTEYGYYPLTASPSCNTIQLKQMYDALNGSNYNRKVFFQIDQKQWKTVDANGRAIIDSSATTTNFIDPWENSYRVSFCTNQSHRVDTPFGQINGDFAIWSYGPDGIESETKDNIVSW